MTLESRLERKPVATEKFYFFDLGVARSLARAGEISLGTSAFGKALEHLILLELISYKDYNWNDTQIHYWRSQSQMEVDFLLDESIAIEVKATARVSLQDLKGLKALEEDIPLKRKIVVCSESERRVMDGIELIPYQEFLDDLWQHKITESFPGR